MENWLSKNRDNEWTKHTSDYRITTIFNEADDVATSKKGNHGDW